MALLEIDEFSFSYPEERQYAVKKVKLAVKQGEFVLICGPSGSGKTTLLRHMKQELAPVGKCEGELRYAGRPLAQLPAAEAASRIGLVQQDPENQTVTDRVLTEIVFGMENLGFSSGMMRRRAAELTHFFGIEGLLQKPMFELSGGQKQMVQLSAVLALQPQLLLLDEPTAQLDPVAATELLQLLHRLNRELGLTVVMSEHRLDDAFHLADRIVVMEEGAVRFEGRPGEVARALWDSGDNRWMAFIPPVPRLFLNAVPADETSKPAAVPLTLKEGVHLLSTVADFLKTKVADRPAPGTTSPLLLECRDLSFQYDPKSPAPVIRNASMGVRAGDIFAILGSNGSGKTTFLKLLAGILVPQYGSILEAGKKRNKRNKRNKRKKHNQAGIPKIGYLDQNPLNYFSEETVENELLLAAQRAGAANPREKGEQMADQFGLLALLGRHPYDLSAGERQLTALASVLMGEPGILLLDEPTKGLDPFARDKWGERLRELRRQGITVVMATHDIEFAAQTATACAMMFDGAVAAVGEPEAFFRDNLYYTTARHRLMRLL